MHKLTDDQVKADWNGLQKRQRGEIAERVAQYCVGRTMADVSKLLGQNMMWVRRHLDLYAVETATGGGTRCYPLSGSGKAKSNVDHEVSQLLSSYSPSEPDADYVAEYEAEGHTPEVAKRLARSYEAAEVAIEKGVIQETVTKQNERAARIVLPSGTDWELRLRRAVSDVKAAIKLLDDANISDLKRAITRKRIAEVHVLWMEQIERLQNFHPTFNDEVMCHEA